MPQARPLTDAELDAVAAGDGLAAAVSLSAAGLPGVPVSISITAVSVTAAAAGGLPSATIAVGVVPGAVVVGTVLTQAVAPV